MTIEQTTALDIEGARLQAQVATAQAELAEARAEAQSSYQLLQATTAQVAAVRAEINGIRANIDGVTEKSASMAAQLQTSQARIAELKASEPEKQRKAEAMARVILAAHGHADIQDAPPLHTAKWDRTINFQ